MKTNYVIQDGKLILKSDLQVEIPISQILWVKFTDNLKDPKIRIETESGITTVFGLDPKDKQKIKNLINRERTKLFAKK